MDATMAAEARERVTKWIEDTRQLFALLPELLASDPQVNERISAAQKEVEKLKKEVEDLRKENHTSASRRTTSRRRWARSRRSSASRHARAPSSVRRAAMLPRRPSQRRSRPSRPSTRRPEDYARADLNVAADFTPASFLIPSISSYFFSAPGSALNTATQSVA